MTLVSAKAGTVVEIFPADLAPVVAAAMRSKQRHVDCSRRGCDVCAARLQVLGKAQALGGSLFRQATDDLIDALANSHIRLRVMFRSCHPRRQSWPFLSSGSRIEDTHVDERNESTMVCPPDSHREAPV